MFTSPALSRLQARSRRALLCLEPLEDRTVPSDFGTDGVVTTELGGTDVAEALALYPAGLPDAGKIVVVTKGTTELVRYTFLQATGTPPRYFQSEARSASRRQVEDLAGVNPVQVQLLSPAPRGRSHSHPG